MSGQKFIPLIVFDCPAAIKIDRRGDSEGYVSLPNPTSFRPKIAEVDFDLLEGFNPHFGIF